MLLELGRWIAVLIGITGAHGFLGSHLWAGLRKRACDVKVFERGVHDLSDVASMKDFVEDLDAIFHLGGVIRVSDEELINVNALGTFRLLEAIRRYANNDVRVVLASTLHAYGVTDTPRYLNENDIPMPKTAYGLSKLLAEEIINFYGNKYGMKERIFRIANVYGPECKPHYNSVIATYIDLILRNKPLQAIGNGVRDYIYVSDVFCGFFESLKHNFTSDRLFNLCTGVPVTVNEIIEMLKDIIDIIPMVEHRNTDALADYLVGDPGKFLENIGEMSFTDLSTGLRKTVTLDIVPAAHDMTLEKHTERRTLSL
ncbi:MAG: NAD-dependent epimerase/dehydratase family protein [Halobacteriota archaeon]